MRLSTVHAIVVVLCACAFVSCARKTESNSGLWESDVPSEGIVIAQGAPFFVAGPSGAVTWNAALDFGSRLRTRPQSDVIEHSVGQESQYLYPVTLHGPDGDRQGWLAKNSFTTGKVKPAVVVSKTAFVTSGADGGSDVVGSFSRMDLVAAGTDAESGCNPVTFPGSSEETSLESGWIQSSSLSFKSDDVQAAILLRKAFASRDAAERDALIRQASERYASSAFAADIAALLSSPAAESASGPSAAPAVEDIVATLTVSAESANVYDEPSFDSAVAGTVSFDDAVRVAERTTETFESGDATARWYRLEAPVAGWIFGVNLEGAD